MGLIEDLRRQKAVEQSEARRRADETARRDQRTREESARNQERARAEAEARARALRESVVPQLARELADLTGKKLQPFSQPFAYGFNFLIDNKTKLNMLRTNTVTTSIYFQIEGQEDGSIRIGDRTLSHSQANVPSVVETALERAYQHPVREKIPNISDWRLPPIDGAKQ